MSLLFDAATAWSKLSNTEYIFLLSKKAKKVYTVKLHFPNKYFYHISGVPKAKDIDFGINRSLYYGEKLIGAILSGKLDSAKLERSALYQDCIKGRLETIINLESTLDGDFEIAKFDGNKLPFHCNIDANYIIRNKTTNDTFFIFISEDGMYSYCKTGFINNGLDYMRNQSKLTLLKKDKYINNIIVSQYTHPHYNPNLNIAES